MRRLIPPHFAFYTANEAFPMRLLYESATASYAEGTATPLSHFYHYRKFNRQYVRKTVQLGTTFAPVWAGGAFDNKEFEFPLFKGG